MYSFGQRTDTVVHDEPLYAAYLTQTGASRPYRDEVLTSQDTDGDAVMQAMLDTSREKVVYAKQMGKFVNSCKRKWLSEGVHVVLVRDPMAVVRSFSEVLEATLDETCYPDLCRIVSSIRSLGKKPIVVLSEDLVQRPEATLRALCNAIGMPFDPAMMRWPAGPKPYDGCWASYWYRNVHQSSGWDRPSSAADARKDFTEELKPLLHECYAMFSLLLPHAIIPEAQVLKCSRGMGDKEVGRREGDAEGISDSLSGQLSFQGDAHLHAIPRSPSLRHGPPVTGTHVYAHDPRNADILVGMRDGVSKRFTLEWRPAAKVSVLDAGFVLGDGVWEGIRVHKGIMTFAREHLSRLYQGAKALDIALDLTPSQLSALLYRCLDANGMRHGSGVHVRLMVTRGLKPTPYQNPRCIIGSPTIVILPEWKEAASGPKEQGIKLSTVHVRRGSPDVQDQMWNSHSKLNCITACIQANAACADEGLMLDPHGFVATCNSVNFFIVVRSHPSVIIATVDSDDEDDEVPAPVVLAPTDKYQLHGITRLNVLRLCAAHGIASEERDFTLTTAYSADEAFVTGTFAGVVPVVSIDGRTIGDGARGPVTANLQNLYAQAMDAQATRGRQSLQ